MADGASLGAPACNAGLGVYLKAVYACVSKDVLKKEYQNTDEQVGNLVELTMY